MAAALAAAAALTSVIPGKTAAADPAGVMEKAEAVEAAENGGTDENTETAEAVENAGTAETSEMPATEGKTESEDPQGSDAAPDPPEPEAEPDTSGTSEAAGTADTLDTEIAKEEDPSQEIRTGRFLLKFDSEGGVVKIIVGSDEGASEDEPSYMIQKTAEGTVHVTERNGNEYDASEVEDGSVLTIEEQSGCGFTVIAESAEGYSVSDYVIETDAGSAAETGFSAPAQKYSYSFEIAEGSCTAEIAFARSAEEKDKAALMPEFKAVKKAGKYTVRIHAPVGVLPKGTKAEVREMPESEAKPYAEKAEEMADVGMAVAVIDITFKDPDGKEIKPSGMVEVAIENAAQERKTMSVYHADKRAASKMELVPSKVEGTSVRFENDSFSPYVLMSATAEPNWLAGGTGTKTDVTKDVSVKFKSSEIFRYSEYNLGNFFTVMYVLEANGTKSIGGSVCGDPYKEGRGLEGRKAERVYEYTTPMLVKAMYYGQGPGYRTLQSVTGTDNKNYNNIILHITASQIYAALGSRTGGRMGSTKSSPGDGFKEANAKAKDLAYAYAHKLESLPEPSGYYTYVADPGSSGYQDFLFNSTALSVGYLQIKKDVYPSEDAMKAEIYKNVCYSRAGASYGIYDTGGTAEVLRGKKPLQTLVTLADGKTPVSEALRPGKYYIVELSAPKGYVLSNLVTEANVKSGEKSAPAVVQTYDHYQKVGLRIIKTPKGLKEGETPPPMQGAVFRIYKDGARQNLIGTLTTGEDGKTPILSKDPDGNPLPMQKKYYVTEITAPEGYDSVGTFWIDGTQTEEGKEYSLIDRTIKEPVQASSAVLRIVKKSSDDRKGPSLAHTQFEFRYYDGIYRSESELPQSPTRTWTIETFEDENGEYAADLYNCQENGTFLEGDAFYLDEAGKPVLPLGTIAVTEKKAAQGYYNEPDFGGGAGILIGNIVRDETGKPRIDVVQGSALVGSTATVTDVPMEPEIRTSACDAQTGSHLVYAGSGRIRLIDKVSYKNLNENTVYILLGTLMDKATGEPFTGADGSPVTGTTVFRTGEALDGSAEVVFEFEGTREQLEGRTLVVKEELTADDSNEDAERIPGAAHWDPEDREQTIYFPQIGTTLVHEDSGLPLVPAGAETVLTDTIAYRNLIPGTAYRISGTLMDKASGKPLQIGGQTVTAGLTFTPSKADGTVDVPFRLNTEGLEGKELVAFEEIYEGDRLVADHKELQDFDQTIVVPGVTTDVSIQETGTKTMPAEGKRILCDDVHYTGLIANKTYEISGEVKVKEHGKDWDSAQTVPSSVVSADAHGRGEVKIEGGAVLLTPSGSENEVIDGVVTVSFEVDGSNLRGSKLVVGESVKVIHKEIAVHKDLTDDHQTVSIPDGWTSAGDAESGSRVVMPDEEVRIVDTFEYRNLVPGETYAVRPRVMKKSSAGEIPSTLTEARFGEGTEGAMIQIEDNAAVFTPEAGDGALELTLAFDASELKGEDVVLFETVSRNDVVILRHEDIHDEEQTIHFPSMGTRASDQKDGDKKLHYTGTVTVEDTITYSNLMPGKEYYVSGTLMNKTSGKPARSGGRDITGHASFTADSGEGTVVVRFTMDASELETGDYVAFEELYEIHAGTGDKVLVGEHKDIEDQAQTVHRPQPPKSQTPSRSAKTGDTNEMYIWLGIFAAAAAGALITRKVSRGRFF